MNALFSNIDFVLADGLACRNYLPVYVGKAYLVIIYQIERTDSAPCKSLNGISADTAYAENGTTPNEAAMEELKNEAKSLM
jgi:hypothetical protein